MSPTSYVWVRLPPSEIALGNAPCFSLRKRSFIGSDSGNSDAKCCPRARRVEFSRQPVSTGLLYAWELERGRRIWRVPVRGGVVTNDGLLCASLAELGMGLAYAPEPMVVEQLGEVRLKIVLERYAPVVPGDFLYFPSRARSSAPLRLFIE